MRTSPILQDGAGPKRRQRRHSYDENVDESGKLIDNEPTDIEHEVPADETEPVELPPEDDRPEPPVFEE